jgi:hypothetical protein
MILLTNSYALGSLAGGLIVGLLSSFLIHDAEAWFLFVAAGYAVAGCIAGAIYGATVKVLGFGRGKISSGDAVRGFITATVCTVGQYLIGVVARTHEYDRVMLFAVPLGAALVDTMRVRRSRRMQESAAPPLGDGAVGQN